MLMGELFRQSDPACFLHAAVRGCWVWGFCGWGWCIRGAVQRDRPPVRPTDRVRACVHACAPNPHIHSHQTKHTKTTTTQKKNGQAEWCVDRAASAPHQLPALHDFFQGEAYEHEWVDRGGFPKCQVRGLVYVGGWVGIGSICFCGGPPLHNHQHKITHTPHTNRPGRRTCPPSPSSCSTSPSPPRPRPWRPASRRACSRIRYVVWVVLCVIGDCLVVLCHVMLWAVG